MDIITQIDRWAELSPGRPAHVSGEAAITYGELRRQSDSLAAYLASRWPGERGPVALLGQREPEMLVGFLGCVKAGRPYIPVDASVPAQRLERILSRAAVTLTPQGIAEIAKRPRERPAIALAAEDPWYIIFTSGSTGDPKGMVITRRCLETFAAWLLEEQKFSEQGEIFLNHAPFSFDLSVADVYGALLTGGTLFSLAREVVANPRRLFQTLGRCNATVSFATPSFARMCLAEPTYRESMLPAMRKFLFCGETLPPDTAARMMDRFPNAEIWNTYGPTEATVAMTSVRLDREILRRYPALPVGAPMPGVRVYLIDDSLQPLPDGARGEIVIAGPNVTPGYLDDPERNAAAFVFHEGRRGYRTGDQGCLRDGQLFCEGRKDGQIKLNGYRIELGDIEANLRALPGVHEAIVLPMLKEGATHSLTAFLLVADGRPGRDFERTLRLQSALLERLPAYMLPRKFVYLDQFPMTPNGKVDRGALARALV